MDMHAQHLRRRKQHNDFIGCWNHCIGYLLAMQLSDAINDA
jgi:hypothetical protein